MCETRKDETWIGMVLADEEHQEADMKQVNFHVAGEKLKLCVLSRCTMYICE